MLSTGILILFNSCVLYVKETVRLTLVSSFTTKAIMQENLPTARVARSRESSLEKNSRYLLSVS